VLLSRNDELHSQMKANDRAKINRRNALSSSHAPLHASRQARARQA
jgi:hypothetical protein